MGKGRPPATNRVLPTTDDLQPTRALTPDELECWERWRGVIQATRKFLSTDAPLLTFIVDLEMRKAKARASLEKVDPYESGRRHPALTDLDNAHRDLMAILRELGLTPASLKNVNMGERRTAEGDSLETFLEDGK